MTLMRSEDMDLNGDERTLSATNGSENPPVPVPTDVPGRAVVIDGESALLFEDFRRELRRQFRRTGPLADVLIDQLAGVLWRLRRSAGFEAALIGWLSHQQAQMHDKDGVSFGGHFVPTNRRSLSSTGLCPSQRAHRHQCQRLGRTLEAADSKSDLLGRMGRYEAHLMRQATRLLQELQRQEKR